MKIAFSTLGCPDWSWSEIFVTAKDLKFDGIECRGISNHIYTPDAPPFTAEHIDKTIQRLKAANIEIPVVTSGVTLGTGDTGKNTDEGKDYVELAKKLGSFGVRVMISPNPYVEEVNYGEAVSRMKTLCDYAKNTGVNILAETNGILAESKAAVKFMEDVSCDNAGILWDIHHPYRYFSEQPEYTYNNIKPYIKHVHVKDSVIKDDKINYRMMGYGDVPVYDCLKLLNSGGYDGYISLEWVKRWNPDMEEAGIVFPHFANYIRHLTRQL